jgi:hypothetical protein
VSIVRDEKVAARVTTPIFRPSTNRGDSHLPLASVTKRVGLQKSKIVPLLDFRI